MPTSNINSTNSISGLTSGHAQADVPGTDKLRPYTKYPTAKEVTDFHRNADTNKQPESIHHTLGNSRNQASPGDHLHDGSSGALLLQGTGANFSENLGTNQGLKDAVKQLIQQLANIGAVDLTSVSGVYPEVRTGSVICTWAATGQFSPSTPFTFSSPMTGTPNVVLTCRNTSTSVHFNAKNSGTISSSGSSIMAWASASQAIGATVTVDYIAILMKTFT